MKTLTRLALIVAAAFAAPIAVAQFAPSNTKIVVQGADSTGTKRDVRTDTNGAVQTKAPTFAATGAPTFTLAASTTSAAATGLIAGRCYEVSCSDIVKFRTGSGTPTALTTDRTFYGPGTREVCLPATDTAIAVVTAAGTATCEGSLVTTAP